MSSKYWDMRAEIVFVVIISFISIVNGLPSQKNHNSEKERSLRRVLGKSTEADVDLRRQISMESDPVHFFKNFIGNVKVKEEKDGSAYLTDLDGKPLLGDDKKNIFIAKSKKEQPGGLERGLSVIHENAFCQLRTVPFHVDYPYRKPYYYYYPPCVELTRCTGCCVDLLRCTATKTREIIVLTYELEIVSPTEDIKNPNAFDFVGHRNLTMIEDTECFCQCTTHPDDCEEDHVYSSKNCQCECPGDTDTHKQDCEDNIRDTGMGWDYRSCSCECPQLSCHHNEYFDEYDCECLDSSFKRQIRTRRDIFNTTDIGKRIGSDATAQYFSATN